MHAKHLRHPVLFGLIVSLGLLGTASAFGATVPCASTVTLATGSGCFLFKDRASPSPMTVWYHKPKKASASSQILFSLHGMSRTGKSHRDIWVQEAERRGVLVIAPEFSKADFPSEASYTLGNMDAPEPSWGFSLIERLFDAVRQATASTQATYFLFGHSAGAQFTQRMVLFKSSARLAAAVAANAGVYAFPTFDTRFPHGLGGSSATEASLKKALQTRLYILLGDQDNDPKDQKLSTSPAAMAQGKNRVERGQKFHAEALSQCKSLKITCAWKLELVPGVGHNPAGMVARAAQALF